MNANIHNKFNIEYKHFNILEFDGQMIIFNQTQGLPIDLPP